jgi:hypothetical protein
MNATSQPRLGELNPDDIRRAETAELLPALDRLGMPVA